MKKIIFFSITFLMFYFFLSCRKEVNNPVPQATVDAYIYLDNPTYINLKVSGGWVYINGGVRGIIVYRKSNDEFMAYDRNCTYQPENACATVKVDKSSIIAVDTCCHSEFLLTDGSVLKAPATIPLKAYRNSFDGNVLHIYN